MDEQAYWSAVVGRDGSYDEQFVYGVCTTGIYCRPSCASRQPRRANVAFFANAVAAEQAGFRACKRCQPQSSPPRNEQRELMAQICRYLDAPHPTPPTLAELGTRFALSPHHLQRVFTRIVGVSPRQYADARRQERFKQQLKNGDNVTGALFDAGYNSGSSFYMQPDTLGMTPSDYQQGGAAQQIRFVVTECALGWLLVAATGRGVAKVSLGDDATALEAELHQEFPHAVLLRDAATLHPWVATLLAHLAGEQPDLALPLDIQATAFQRKVYDALRAIPYGSTRSYQQIATAIGQPTATRAVASACAHNPVALIVPCHRVVRANGSLSGYRWGVARKQAILEREAAG